MNAAIPFFKGPIKFPIVGPIRGTIKGGLYPSVIELIKAMNPLIATDPRLATASTRPVSGGDMLTFDGATQSITVASLTGSETVTSSDGTSTPSIAAGVINFTAGTSANVILSNGSIYRLGETTGITAYDSSSNAANGVLVNSPTPTVNNTLAYSSWNQQGGSERMFFDGVDDYVSNPAIDFRLSDSSGKISFSFITTATGQISFFSSSDTSVTSKYVQALMRPGGHVAFWVRPQSGGDSLVRTTSAFNDGVRHTVDIISNGSAYDIIVDGVSQSLTIVLGANDGRWFDQVTSRDNFYIGALETSSGVAQYASGIVWDLSVFDSSLTKVNEWLGLNATDAGWLDQIGSNDGTVTGGSTIRIPKLEASPLDALGDTAQYRNSAYPVIPNITGGTVGALTAFNTNVADGGIQSPEILAAGLPATWIQADGSVPILQLKDNGDATSSLALGFEDAPTAAEQLTIDKYHE